MKEMKLKSIIWIVIAVIVVLLGVTSFYRIEQDEVGLVLTFNKITDQKDAGLYWHIPMVQKVVRQSRENIYTVEYGFRTVSASTSTAPATYTEVPAEGIMLTSDNNLVFVEAIYQFTVADVSKFKYEVDDPFGTMQYAFETILRRNIQNSSLDDALLNKDKINKLVKPDFEALCRSYGLGIEISDVSIQNIEVPAEVLDAYQDVNNAENEKTRNLDEAEKYSNEVVPAARGDAYEMIESAEGYKAQTIAVAEGEVTVFNQVYEKYVLSPEITRTRLIIETLEKVLSDADYKYVMNQASGDTLKFLPIDNASKGGE